MNFEIRKTAISVVALTYACAAQAGEVPLYEEAPAWVEKVSIDEVSGDEPNDLIVYDLQTRIEEGRRWDYQDRVYRISALTDLSRAGTLTLQWLPDKGDLIVHEISIIRDGTVINVLSEGGELEVLRRERMLERGILNGYLTATINVPGLAVDDQLRLRYSVTTSDQALGKEVQSQTVLWREQSGFSPAGAMAMLPGMVNQEADFSRLLVSWPETLDVQYQAGPNVEIGKVEARDGYEWLDVALPLPEADPLPYDAPLRYRLAPRLQVGTFADWAEVSSTMSPYYQTEGSLDGLAELLEKADAIAAQPVSDLEKAVDALELVQEDIRYLLNGLDGGNYIPQDVSTTWEMKFGDCKAKTLMLLALLDHLGIEAEAVLVSTDRGNAVPTSLPIPGAFNHVIVRATIEGQEYFLDGTSVGANVKTIGNVPPFEHFLAIRDSGATLQAIEQVLPRVAEMEMHIEVDASAGIDLPTLGTIRLVMIGPAAVQMNAQSDAIDEIPASRFNQRTGRDGRVIDVWIEEGGDDSEATMAMTVIMPPIFEFEGTRGEFIPSRSARVAGFSPDRSRRQWRDIPVAIGNPSSSVTTVRAQLGIDVDEFDIQGSLQFEGGAAGTSLTRNVEIDGSEVFVFEKHVARGG